MHLLKPTVGIALLVLLVVPTALLGRAPKVDPNRIINNSYSFLKNREPEMTATEYALYERVVSMLAVQPDFAMQLLESMTSGKERPSAAFEFVLGNAHYTGGRVELAERHYLRAIELYPDYLRAWTNLGVLHYTAGRHDEAVRCLSKAVELGDGTSDTLGLLAFALGRTGHTVAAEMAYLRALSVAPRNADWMDGLCGLYIEGKQFGRAESLARQLVQLEPHEARHWQHYAGILLAQNRASEALVVLETGRSLAVTAPELLLQLGDLYAQAKFGTEAVATYREAMKQQPSAGVKRLIGYALALVDLGDLQQAGGVLEKLVTEVPAEQRVPFLLARAEWRAGSKDWSGARRELETLLADWPLHGPALLRLGQVCKAAGETEAAQQAFAAAVQRPETAYRAHLELAELELRARHYRRCTEHLEQALAIEKSPVVQAYLEKIRDLTPKDENTAQ
jgi:tetratricopeptide (TPR) repeat protein